MALVVKAGDQGSLEAIVDWIAANNKQTQERDSLSPVIETALAAALQTLQQGEATKEQETERRRELLQLWRPLRVVKSGVGPVSASDVRYAQMTGAIVLAFGVTVLDHMDQVRLRHSHNGSKEAIYALLLS